MSVLSARELRCLLLGIPKKFLCMRPHRAGNQSRSSSFGKTIENPIFSAYSRCKSSASSCAIVAITVAWRSSPSRHGGPISFVTRGNGFRCTLISIRRHAQFLRDPIDLIVSPTIPLELCKLQSRESVIFRPVAYEDDLFRYTLAIWKKAFQPGPAAMDEGNSAQSTELMTLNHHAAANSRIILFVSSAAE